MDDPRYSAGAALITKVNDLKVIISLMNLKMKEMFRASELYRAFQRVIIITNIIILACSVYLSLFSSLSN
jgi:hypothetical protein